MTHRAVVNSKGAVVMKELALWCMRRRNYVIEEGSRGW
jgi:hypothetical protein